MDHHSLSLSWESAGDGVTGADETPITGYVISYKSNQDSWEELKVTGRRSRHVLENLRCGTKYQISVTAFNPAGRSKPSDLVAAATAGNGRYPQVTGLLPPSPSPSRSSVPRLTSHFSRETPWMPGEENKGLQTRTKVVAAEGD